MTRDFWRAVAAQLRAGASGRSARPPHVSDWSVSGPSVRGGSSTSIEPSHAASGPGAPAPLPVSAPAPAES